MNYKRIYDEMIHHRKLNPVIDGYKEKHHVIPRSLGGSNRKDNIVILTAKEHYVAHLLLTKIYKIGSNEWYKMVRAFMMMAHCKSSLQGRERYTGRIYAKYRTIFSEIMKVTQSGVNNPHYGMKWIFSIDEKRSIRVPKEHVLLNGWYNGRVMKFDGINSIDDLKENRKRIYDYEKIRNRKLAKKKGKTEQEINDKINRRHDIRINRAQDRYDGYVNSGMKLNDYAESIGLSRHALYDDFSLIEEYKNSIKIVKGNDAQEQDAIRLYSLYKQGGYKSLREFSRSEDINISWVTLSNRFRKFIPEYIGKNNN